MARQLPGTVSSLIDYAALVLQNTQCFTMHEAIALILIRPSSYRLFLSISVVWYFHPTQ